jgi:hypothetical protein
MQSTQWAVERLSEMFFSAARLLHDDAFRNLVGKQARATGPGLLSALVLHALAIALIILLHVQIGSPPEPSALRIVPVDVVQLGEQTLAPPTSLHSAVPQQQRVPTARQEEASPVPPEGVSPRGTKPVPLDNLAAKLRALARLRQPETGPRVAANTGQADVTSASDDAAYGEQSTYSVRDFVRQQVVRHWSLDLHALGARNFAIAIHVVMTRTGAIEKAEIVDQQRYRADAVFRDIALSARNAVLLSSPVPLPAGNYPEKIDMTLNFSPRDVLR